jgi:hypothetical protein
MISKLLFEHHDVASKFAGTCQEAWHLIMRNTVGKLFIDHSTSMLRIATDNALPDFLAG